MAAYFVNVQCYYIITKFQKMEYILMEFQRTGRKWWIFGKLHRVYVCPCNVQCALCITCMRLLSMVEKLNALNGAYSILYCYAGAFEKFCEDPRNRDSGIRKCNPYCVFHYFVSFRFVLTAQVVYFLLHFTLNISNEFCTRTKTRKPISADMYLFYYFRYVCYFTMGICEFCYLHSHPHTNTSASDSNEKRK